MSEVVTQLTIDASGAQSGSDSFIKAMEQAEAAVGKSLSSITDGASAVNAALTLVGLGGVTALTGLITYATQANKALADIQQTAKEVGLSLDSYQSIKFAANLCGVDDKSLNTSLEESSRLLNDAQRNANSLSKLFDANGLSIKNANGDLITENQLLNNAANLIARARTEQDKIDIAKMLGFQKQLVPFLEQGADALQATAASAKDAGVVISSDTIAKAADFDEQWRKSSVAWAAYMKAAAAEILPYIDQLIDEAAKIFSKENLKAIAKPGQDAISATGLPDQLNIHITDDAVKAVQDLNNSTDSFSGNISKFVDAVSRLYQGTSVNAGGSLAQLSLPALDFGPTIAALNAKRAKDADSAQDDAQDAAGSHTKIPANAVSNDALDRAILTLTKHTAQTEADTAAVGLGAGALAEYRAQAALTTAAAANGTVVTQAMADKFQDLAQDAGDAATALEKAKVASDIKFGSGSAFLSESDVKIAQQLKGIYGYDIPAALSSSEAAAIRFTDATRDLSTSIQSDLVTGLSDITLGTKTASQGFTDLGLAVVKAIEQMIIKLTIVTPLAQALQGALGGFNFFGGATPAISSGLGAGTGGLAFPTFHTGGIIGIDGGPDRYLHPSYFDNAPRFHTGGIAGDEVPIVAKRGEGVFTPGQMAALGGGSGQPIVFNYSPVINNQGADTAAVTKLATVIAQDKRDFEKNVTGIMTKFRSNNPGANR